MGFYGLLIFSIAFMVSTCVGSSDLPSHCGVGGSISGGSGSSTSQAATVPLVASPASVTRSMVRSRHRAR